MRTQAIREESAAPRRMPATERRALVLEAATGVFGSHGYVGTTTEQVARAAGVSQPYVVRMFGSKENLFVEVIDRAVDRLLAAFRAALERRADDEPVTRALGGAYADLLGDRGLLLSLMHAFVLGSEPVIGPAARSCFMRAYGFIREEAGMDAGEAHSFLAEGMLLNTLVGTRLPLDYGDDPSVRELIDATLPADKRELLLGPLRGVKA